ncbi:MAG: hypothetical protein E7174_05245 [Firmicutes bacterium]|nr:hypothetical protein [Bacillota bacterium]
MRSERRKKVMTLSILAVCVLTISIGFAVFSSTLNIKSTASVNPDASKFGVIFSNDGNSTSTTQTVNPNLSTYGGAATITNGINPVISGLSAKFTAPGDSVTYTFYAKNTGEYLAYLNYITFIGNKTCTPGTGTTQALVDSACNGISMSVKVGNDAAVTGSTSLITNHTLAAGTREQVVVTISYASDAARADGSFTVTFGDVMLTYSSVADFVPEEPICKLVDDVAPTGISEGDEYLCAVEEGMDLESDEGYTFFVLPGQNADGKTNLIMYANINASGQPVDSDDVEDKGEVSWYNENSCGDECTNEYGPVTAMNYLNTATSSWKEELRLNETYTDEGGVYGTITLNGKARLPKLSEVSNYDEENGTNAYLYDYLDNEWGGVSVHSVTDVWGYWTLATEDRYFAIAVLNGGYLIDNGIVADWEDGSNKGVRPVITVQL